tara:strand:- start:645 stop:824 length:180 start_codon:yes stop_codon:yes gene_type:complete
MKVITKKYIELSDSEELALIEAARALDSFYNKKHYIEYVTRIINDSLDLALRGEHNEEL